MKNLLEEKINVSLQDEKNLIEREVIHLSSKEFDTDYATTIFGNVERQGDLDRRVIEKAKKEEALLYGFGAKKDVDKVLDGLSDTYFRLKSIAYILEFGNDTQIMKMFNRICCSYSKKLAHQEFVFNYIKYKQMDEAMSSLFKDNRLIINEDTTQELLAWASKETAEVILTKTLHVYSSTLSFALELDNVAVLKQLLEHIINTKEEIFYQKNPLTISDSYLDLMLDKYGEALGLWFQVVATKRAILSAEQLQKILKDNRYINLWDDIFKSTILTEEAQKIVVERGDDALIYSMIIEEHRYTSYHHKRLYNNSIQRTEDFYEDLPEKEQTKIEKFVFKKCIEKSFVRSLKALYYRYEEWFGDDAKESILKMNSPELIYILDVNDSKTQLRVLRECSVECFQSLCKFAKSISRYVSQQIIKRNNAEELLVLASYTKDEEIIKTLCNLDNANITLSLINNRKEHLSQDVRAIILERDNEDEVLLLEGYPYKDSPKQELCDYTEEEIEYTLEDLIERKQKDREMKRYYPESYKRTLQERVSLGVEYLQKQGILVAEHPFPTGYKVISSTDLDEFNRMVDDMTMNGWHIASHPQTGPIDSFSEYSKSSFAAMDSKDHQEDWYSGCYGNRTVTKYRSHSNERHVHRSKQGYMVALVTYRDSYIDEMLDANERW